jgi:hypothetical protein
MIQKGVSYNDSIEIFNYNYKNNIYIKELFIKKILYILNLKIL